MKAKLKNQLRKLLLKTAHDFDPAFVEDAGYLNDPQFYAIKRRASADQCQFIALSFSPTSDRFYVEVALAPDTFPIYAFPLSPEDPLEDGKLRFRAVQFWSRPSKSGGWLIVKRGDPVPADIIFPPEGIFETPEAAIADVKERMTKWILPYFDAVGGEHRRQ